MPNATFFPFGSTWVPNWPDLDTTKTKMCSLIASAKRELEGHALRHEIVEWAKAEGVTLDVMGGGYQRFKAKSDGLAPYRYSVVIENVRERDYFTEKLIDALLCKTVPIYWGCPNIAEYFDTSGMIICESAADIQQALRSMSEADYNARLPALEAIRETAAGYGDIHGRAARAVLEAAGHRP
ncbi:glycosyltransferase family 10 domain-containing protein [Roseovarius bejariae]|uniref:glycosyltransferase family 10 domain-containing protein n=1 Tax=Roseovarius bejariae TaxID=2576383 RepID=UPI001FE2CFF5|nr:glycosyltransferase family 10 [Roseovarius bejariae]